MRIATLLLPFAVATGCSHTPPVAAEEPDGKAPAIEMVLSVEEEGTRTDPDLPFHEGRVIRVTVGEAVMDFDPEGRRADSVREYLRDGIASGRLDPATTRVTLTVQENVKYADVVLVFDALDELSFEQIDFG